MIEHISSCSVCQLKHLSSLVWWLLFRLHHVSLLKAVECDSLAYCIIVCFLAVVYFDVSRGSTEVISMVRSGHYIESAVLV